MLIINGNLLDTDLKVLIHGCNAQGAMGAGIALQVRNRWPNCYITYRDKLSQMRKELNIDEGLTWDDDISTKETEHRWAEATYGLPILWKNPNKDQYVVNLVTQYSWHNATLPAIRLGLETVLLHFEDVKEFAVPKIGCGLGGLSWKDVEQIYLDLEPKYDMEFHVYDKGP